MSSDNPIVASLTSLPVPSVAEVDRIAALTHPVMRNLLITQCYCELSAAFAERAGPGANWCTFATWASKQAGQTIRREDLKRALEAMFTAEPQVDEAMSSISESAMQLNLPQTPENIRQPLLSTLIDTVTARAADAVSRGNKKVFEEIAREFARFMATCFTDTVYNKTHIEAFCSQLRPGLPPEGQDYLCRAFTRYYALLFESDPKKQAEARHLANLEIGFHEQNRLQPEIAESLNTAIDPKWLKNRLLAIMFPGMGFWGRLLIFFKQFFFRTGLLDKPVNALIQWAQHHLRLVITAHLMTLTIPPDNRLRLGTDLAASYPAYLQNLADHDLLALLAQLDPTPGSLSQSGATDWADLPERMHYIAELFRCYYDAKDLFSTAFTAEQLAALRENRMPAGRL